VIREAETKGGGGSSRDVGNDRERKPKKKEFNRLKNKPLVKCQSRTKEQEGDGQTSPRGVTKKPREDDAQPKPHLLTRRGKQLKWEPTKEKGESESQGSRTTTPGGS